jgi:hypothetical protein
MDGPQVIEYLRVEMKPVPPGKLRPFLSQSPRQRASA